MKIRDLKLLSEHYSGGSFSGMENMNTVSWSDLILKDIVGDKLFLETRKGIRGEGEKKETNLKKNAYDKLNDEQKEKLDSIFKNNINNTIEKILDIDFEN